MEREVYSATSLSGEALFMAGVVWYLCRETGNGESLHFHDYGCLARTCGRPQALSGDGLM